MKKIKTYLKISLLSIGLLTIVKTTTAQTISNHFFGVNAWMPDTIGNYKACQEPPCFRNGKLHTQWKKIKDSKTTIVRFGGIAPDQNMPTNYQFLRMIDSIRLNGMEPIIQVPFCKGRYTAQQAADIVKYLNVTKNRKIKYWIIANEPNLGYGYTTAAQVAAYFKPFASAMKNVDPGIIIIGPEIAGFKQSMMDGLTKPGGPDDITGKDAAGRYYVDVISFHIYPLGGGNQTRADVISNLTATGAFQDNLNYLNNRLTSCNTYHNRTGASILKTAVTETNVNYTNGSTDNLDGVCASSFIGGQFLAEIYGIGLKCGVDFINLWSVIEGGSQIPYDIGYLSGTSGNKKSLYYHFQLMAENFKGNFVNCTDNQTNIKAFASKDANRVCVMLMNQDLTKNLDYTISLNTSAVTGTNLLKINANAGISKEYSDVLQNQSTILLVFDLSGKIIKKMEYSMIKHATGNLPPTVINFITTGIDDEPVIADVNFDAKVFPNPSVGNFTVEINKSNTEEKEFKIKMFNVFGQEVYNKKSIFADNQEIIALDESVATGVYIMQISLEGKEAEGLTKRIIVSK